MAKWTEAQDSKLTIAFEDKKDLMQMSVKIADALVYLVEKYEKEEKDGPIVVVLDIGKLV